MIAAATVTVLAAAAAGADALMRAPTASEVESAGMRAADAGDRWARLRLAAWSAGGSASAARELAVVRLRGGDVRGGREALERAMVLGDAEAAYQIAEGHRLGRWDLDEDLAAAHRAYRRAADAGHADAPLWLARIARNGPLGPADPVEAFRWLALAAERGNAQAMFLLSNAYAAGEGTAVSLAAARHWLERAAERHFGPAMQAWALALEDGSLGLVDLDASRAVLKEAHDERRHRWNSR